MGQMEEKGKKNWGSSLPKTLSHSFLLSLCHLILSLLVYHCLSLSLSLFFFIPSLCRLILSLLVYYCLSLSSFLLSESLPSCSLSHCLSSPILSLSCLSISKCLWGGRLLSLSLSAPLSVSITLKRINLLADLPYKFSQNLCHTWNIPPHGDQCRQWPEIV